MRLILLPILTILYTLIMTLFLLIFDLFTYPIMILWELDKLFIKKRRKEFPIPIGLRSTEIDTFVMGELHISFYFNPPTTKYKYITMSSLYAYFWGNFNNASYRD